MITPAAAATTSTLTTATTTSTTSTYSSLAAEVPELHLLVSAGQAAVVRAIDTRELTQSFGWGAADAFHQHDVQELLHVLFEALEAEHAGTPQVVLKKTSYAQ